MKPALFFLSFCFAFPVAAEVSFSQSASCGFDIIGMWQAKSFGNEEASPVFYKFAADGTVTVLTGSRSQKSSTSQQTAKARYRLDNSTAPKFIEFTARHAGVFFPAGKNVFPIAEFDEHHFAARKSTGRLWQWIRVPEHRYFLTFVARQGTLEVGGAAFAMWTQFDGRKRQLDALGFYTNGSSGAFGVIPVKLYNQFVTDRIADSDVMLRLELSASEFARTRRIWQVWQQRARTGMLLYTISHLNLMSFLTRVTDSLNQCSARLKVHKLDWSVADEMATQYNLPQIPFQFIKELRQRNHSQHITEAAITEAEWPIQRLPKP
ncbi:MAG: hypothetical protein HY231_22295 [Acidobacteria bacterium]|nr:hypothetical protein [Acidobacteriota bacterium]